MPEPFYPSDLTDAEWEIIDPMLPKRETTGPAAAGRLPRSGDFIFYRADNGIKWRAMPRNFPAWQTVYGYYRVLGEKGAVGED